MARMSSGDRERSRSHPRFHHRYLRLVQQPPMSIHSLEDLPSPRDRSMAGEGSSFEALMSNEYDYDYDEVDHCGANPCKNGGSCDNNAEDSGYICRCTEGYEGDNCETTKKEKTTVGTIILITVVVIIILVGGIALGYHMWTKPEQKKDSKDVDEQGIEMDDLPLGKDAAVGVSV
eukprot:419789_1